MTIILRGPPDDWILRGVHWHGYVHLPGKPLPISRQDRLRLVPHRVLATPDDVADWLLEQGQAYLRRRQVYLLGEQVQVSTAEDAVHTRGWDHDQFAASEARCVYVGHGPVLLYAEIVSHDLCAVIEHRSAA